MPDSRVISTEVTTQFVELIEWDWAVGHGLRVLHYVDSWDAADTLDEDWGGPGMSVCGVRRDWWSIPGIFTRMGAKRCPKCCKALGYPTGIGSPKNDDGCRPILEPRIASITGVLPQKEANNAANF